MRDWFGQFRQLPRELYYLYAGTTITRLGTFVFPFLAIYLSREREYEPDHIGLILSLGSVGLLLGNFTGGWLTDRWSRKRTLIAALLLNAVGFAALAFHYEAAWMYSMFLFVGYFGSGMYTPAANTVIADLAPERMRPFAYTVNYVCINLGMAGGPLIAGFLAGVSFTWIFVGDVVTSLMCAVLIAFGVRETFRRTTERRDLGISPLVWFRHPVVMLFVLANIFLIGPLMALEFTVPLLVELEFAKPAAFVGVVYTINAVAILSLSFLVERIVRHRSEMPMMAVAGVFWTAGLAILVFGFSVPALLICTAVWTIGEIIASILVPTFIARNVAHEVKGRFMALNDIVRSFAGVVCPIGLGYLWETRGVTSVVYVILALPILGIASYMIMSVATRVARGEADAPPVAAEP